MGRSSSSSPERGSNRDKKKKKSKDKDKDRKRDKVRKKLRFACLLFGHACRGPLLRHAGTLVGASARHC